MITGKGGGVIDDAEDFARIPEVFVGGFLEIPSILLLGDGTGCAPFNLSNGVGTGDIFSPNFTTEALIDGSRGDILDHPFVEN